MDIDHIFKKFKGLNALVLGDVMVDAYLFGKVDRISPEAPVPIVNVKQHDARLGGAANVALNVKALGATPIICSVVGNDRYGKIFEQCLNDFDLSDKGVVFSNKRPTTVKTRVIGNNQQIIRIDEEDTSSLTQEEVSLLIKRIEKIIDNSSVDVIIVEDYDKGVLTNESIAAIIDLANKKGIPLTVDPKKKNFLAYKNISLFKPNLKELKEGLNLEFDKNDTGAIKNAVIRLNKELTPELTMVTLSENGVYLKGSSIDELIPAHIRNVADVSGAGDTVISTASLCLAIGLDDKFMATISNLAGGLVCESVGVVPIDAEKLKSEAKKII